MTKLAARMLAPLALIACAETTSDERPRAAEARAPSALDVFERNLAARGGRARYQRLRVVERIGRMRIVALEPPVVGSYRTCVRYTDAGVIAVDAGPIQVFEALAAGRAWACDREFSQCEIASSEKRAELVETARVANREELYELDSVRGAKLTVEGDRVTVAAAKTTYVFSDGGKVLEEKRRGARVRRYSDWRSVSGVAFPFRIADFENGRATVVTELERVELRDTPSAWCQQRLARPRLKQAG